MHSKELGDTGLRIPEIGLGTWKYSGGAEPLLAGIDRGACFIDTAEAYETEEIVGEVIRNCRARVFVATKALPRNFTRKGLVAAAERSLQRLRSDYIDLYQLHWPNYTIPIGEPMGAMEELVQSGKIRFIGVSNFSIEELAKAQAALSRFRIVTNQVRYSLIERTIEPNLLKHCQKNRITIIAYSPLGMGLARIRAADPEGALPRVTAAVGKTYAQVALNWCIAKENVVAIPKASSVEHVLEDCAASGWTLPSAEAQLLEDKIRFRRRGILESFFRRRARHALQLIGRQM